MWNPLLDFLLPTMSLTGTEGKVLTEREWDLLVMATPARFHKDLLTKRGITHLDAIVAAGSYHASPLLKEAIIRFKYRGTRLLAHRLSLLLSYAIPGLLSLDLPHGQKTVLCPIPLHWTRKFSRGFNQSELLAHALAQHTTFTVEHLLTRTRRTGRQVDRAKADRLHALDGAFRYCGPITAPPSVIVIDDLFTTGATLMEAAKTLKKAGVKHVCGLTVAHG